MKNNGLILWTLTFQVLLILVYTIWVVSNDGFDFFNVFVANVLSVSWSGQFNLDFMCYLFLSGIWIMWRNKYSINSIFIGLLSMIFGILFFAPYMLYLIYNENGDLKKVIAG